MANKCTVCTHPSKLMIDREILSGASYTKIANDHGLNFQAVRNHALNHLPRRMVAAFRKKEMAEDLDMMNEFTSLMRDIKEQINEFRVKGKDGLSIKATDTLIRLYQTMAQFASVYYQAQAEENQQQRAIDDEAQRAELYKQLDILSPDEREIFRKMSLKLLTGNTKMDCVGEFIKDREMEKSLAEDTPASPTPRGRYKPSAPVPESSKGPETEPEDKPQPKPRFDNTIPDSGMSPRELRQYWKNAHTNPYK